MSTSMDVEIAAPTQATIYLLDRSAPAVLLRDILPDWTRRLGTAGIKVAEIETSNSVRNLQDLIEFIRTEHYARGAVAPATRSIAGLPDAAFDDLGPNVSILGTFDVIAKANSKLSCRLSVPNAAATALDDILAPAGGPQARPLSTALILGASPLGDGLALHLLERGKNTAQFAEITIADTDVKALNRSGASLRDHPQSTRIAVRHIAHPADLTRLTAVLPDGCLIIHAGTAEPRLRPLIHADGLVFSRGAVIWDPTSLAGSPLLDQAARDARDQNLILADGWRFQLYLLAAKIAEILNLEPDPEALKKMVDSAERAARKRQAA